MSKNYIIFAKGLSNTVTIFVTIYVTQKYTFCVKFVQMERKNNSNIFNLFK